MKSYCHITFKDKSTLLYTHCQSEVVKTNYIIEHMHVTKQLGR